MAGTPRPVAVTLGTVRAAAQARYRTAALRGVRAPRHGHLPEVCIAGLARI